MTVFMLPYDRFPYMSYSEDFIEISAVKIRFKSALLSVCMHLHVNVFFFNFQTFRYCVK